MTEDKDDNGYSDPEIARRRDDAIRRALNTPPKPKKQSSKAKTKAGKRQPSPKKG
jgi:hypothetical protein